MPDNSNRHGRIGKRQFRAAWACHLMSASILLAQSAGPLSVEHFKVGDSYSVSTLGKMEGRLELPPQGTQPARQVPIVGSARVVFRERVVRANANGVVDRVYRVYDESDYQRKIAEQDQETKLRASIRSIIVDFAELEMRPFSLDGSLTYSELELLRTHPVLALLDGFLPAKAVSTGEQWPIPNLAAAHLLDCDPIRSGSLACKYSGDIDFAGKRLAQFAFDGTIVGRTTEGEAKSEVVGAVYVDLATRRLHSIRAVGDRTMLGPQNEPVGKVRVDYQITVRDNPNDPELSNAVLAKIPAKASAADLAVLYEHPGVGVRLKHPRGWMLANVEKNQFKLETKGGVVVLTLEPNDATPKTTEYAAKVAQYLTKMESADAPQRIAIINKSEPQEATNASGRAGNFRYRVKIGPDERFLDYWVRQSGRRGLTASARLTPDEIRRLGLEVAEIVGSVEFFEPPKPTAK